MRPSADERRALCDAHVTLNGKRAVIRGWKRDFATVAAIPHGEFYEYAWETVAHIVADKEGKFTS